MYLCIHTDACISCGTVAACDEMKEKATIKERGITSWASRDTCFSGRNKSLLSLQNYQQNFQQRHNKHPDDILYILCISTNIFSVPSRTWS